MAMLTRIPMTIIRKVRAIALWFLLLSVVHASAQQESVVVVNTEKESGYGVAAMQSDHIVTALHVVAGKSKILVTSKNKSSPATIKGINKEADLALLKLEKPLGVPPLEIYQGDPPTDSRIDYWEVPMNSSRVDRKETKLDAKKRAIPLGQFDNRIARDPQILMKALCADGQAVFPSLTTKVLKFEEANVGKSHSGSPLTYKGRIIGLVDGGQRIGSQASVWAIPAEENFEKLFASPPPPRLKRCSTDRLYGGLRADNPLLQQDPKLKEMADAIAASEKNPLVVRDKDNDQMTFTLVERVAFQDVYETMSAEDQKQIRALVDDDDTEGQQIHVEDLFQESIDIYEDEETGVALAVPTNSRMKIQKVEGRSLVAVSSNSADVEMMFFPQLNDTEDDAEKAQQWFERHITNDGRQWEQERNDAGDDDFEDESLANDRDEPYSTQFMDRVVYGEGDEVVAELYASLTIDENDFLGVAIKVDDWDNMSREKRIRCYVMEACAVMSDFAFH